MKRGMQFVLLLCGLLAFATEKQSPDAIVVGTWEGESICTVRDSPCHDEHVVYEVARDKDSGFKIDAYKIVKGEKDFMGALQCEFDAKTSVLRCVNPGEWVFHVAGTHIDGTLHLLDAKKTLYRRVTLDKK